MKRNKKLLLQILEGIEELPSNSTLEIELGDNTEAEILYHLNLLGSEMIDRLPKYVPAYVVHENVFRINVGGLTMKGHDYLDTLRNELANACWRADIPG